MNPHTAEYQVVDPTLHFLSHELEAMNSLLRGELSAVETYEQALPKFEEMNVRSALSRIRDDHTRAVALLTTHVREMGGMPSEKSGPWGTIVSTITGAAKILGPQTVLGALQQGEEVGIGGYEAMIEDPDTPTVCKNLIHSDLLPLSRAHIQTLDGIARSLER